VQSGANAFLTAEKELQELPLKMDGAWLFAERRLYVDWREERVMA
jgi:hypothetical protein